MKLYGDLLSPFVRMSMVTALEAGLESRVQLQSAALKPHEVNEALAKLSPLGKIPILETDHGRPLYDSRVIMEYFCHVAGNKALLADDGAKHFRVLTLLALAQGLGDAAVALRYETAARPPTAHWPEYAERLRARIRAALDELEGQWAETLAEVNLGSIATAVALGYLDVRHDALAWRNGRGHLATWYEAFSNRPSMLKTQPKV
ncbi:MAG: glutathione S-transferase N-terminal domain-containing protein [Alphaproteobacteria bacterium]|nr:glutathione S-transferase N-terminal domain-containing protein [Alphaproteobacteria bacterium]